MGIGTAMSVGRTVEDWDSVPGKDKLFPTSPTLPASAEWRHQEYGSV
jgi:hypothetical protein